MMIGLRSKKSYLKFLAIFFSFLTWIYVLTTAELQIEKTIKIQYLLPDNVVFSNHPVNEVHYVLTGPRAFIRTLHTREDVITVDLRTRYRKKTKNYEINTQGFNLDFPFGVNVLSIEPKKFNVELVPKVTKEVPVVLKLTGATPSDYKIMKKSYSPTTVTITGPSDILNFIKEIETVPVDLENLKGEGEMELNFLLNDNRVDFSVPQVNFSYVVKPTRANMILRKVPIQFLSTKIIKNVNKRFVTLMILVDKGSEAKITADDVKVLAKVPDHASGTSDVKLSIELPKGVHLLEVNPEIVKIITEE